MVMLGMYLYIQNHIHQREETNAIKELMIPLVVLV